MEIGKQYHHAGHTLTLAKEIKVGDPLTSSLFAEVDVQKPDPDDIVPTEVLRMIYGLVWGVPFDEVQVP